ncbi:uncharacterized protein PV06_08304 [Exophiala oligosperma]|uniref:Uncharacterized protein n=1 Tax=Exophiala oligosperma TaxID=215243 RepID=A0A0D2DB62_9EURO|nr:uncharacterized protein PV06_08304 [Exophiala oligosperma]KIW39715.1 hypothetical protein PV06_08304 [Exophiala oligosperma]
MATRRASTTTGLSTSRGINLRFGCDHLALSISIYGHRLPSLLAQNQGPDLEVLLLSMSINRLLQRREGDRGPRDSKRKQLWVKSTFLNYGIADADTYNFDGTGFAMGQITPSMIVTRAERRGKPKMTRPGIREWATSGQENSVLALDPTPALPATTSVKRSYEDRIREDYEALTKIRKMAEALRVSWDFNMTSDDINNSLLRLEGYALCEDDTTHMNGISYNKILSSQINQTVEVGSEHLRPSSVKPDDMPLEEISPNVQKKASQDDGKRDTATETGDTVCRVLTGIPKGNSNEVAKEMVV